MSSLFQNFRKFVFKQDEDKVIQHNLGWCGCAVGEFLVWDMQTQYDPHGLAAALEQETKASKVILEILNSNGRIDGFDLDDDDDFDDKLYNALAAERFPEGKVWTYGQLQTCIKIIESHLGEGK